MPGTSHVISIHVELFATAVPLDMQITQEVHSYASKTDLINIIVYFEPPDVTFWGLITRE